MNIVVVGVGGVGGYFGARLAEGGHEVTFLTRGKTLEAIQKNGLQVKSIEGDFKVYPKVTDDIADLVAPDLIILAVKSWQVKEVALKLKPILKVDTLILPLQNGANLVDKLQAIIDKKHLLAGFCKIVSKIEQPGIIYHMGAIPEIVFGEINNNRSQRVETVKKAFDQAKFKSDIPENVHLEIWKKFLFIATISGIGGLTRVNLGTLRTDEHLRRMMSETADEIIALGQAKEIPLTEEHKNMVFHFIDTLNYETTASMQRDIMAGKPSELEDFNGYIVKEGERLGVKTPVNYFVYHCLLPMEQQARLK